MTSIEPKSFADVAAMISAPNPPPDWLAPILEMLSNIIDDKITSKRRVQLDDILERTYQAAVTLNCYLPMYYHLFGGCRPPDEIAACLGALPWIIRDLKRARPKPHKGRKPQPGREICAAIMLESWRWLRSGTGGARTEPLQDACKAYWAACGCRAIGKDDLRENWRRPLEAALSTDHVWLRDLFRQAEQK
jgi:hypothetical protein